MSSWVIPRHRVIIQFQELQTILLLLFKGKLIRGPLTEELEERFADFVGARHALAVASGRLGLRLILESLGLEKGQEVILPAYTFHAVPETVAEAGFVPVFVDINPGDYNMDVRLIENKITPMTRAIIATHIYGAPCDIDKILEIARKYNLFVVEDCAQSIGAEFDGKKVGSLGDCGFFSFETAKPFHTFGGGMVVTSNAKVYLKLKELADSLPYPAYRKVLKKIVFSFMEAFFTCPAVFAIAAYPVIRTASTLNVELAGVVKRAKKGFKFLGTKYANFQAAVGMAKFSGLPLQLEQRAANGRQIISQLRPDIHAQAALNNSRPAFYYIALRHPDAWRFRKMLLKHGIDTGAHVTQNCVTPNAGPRYQVAESISNEIVLVPVFPQLEKRDISRIADAINTHF